MELRSSRIIDGRLGEKAVILAGSKKHHTWKYPAVMILMIERRLQITPEKIRKMTLAETISAIEPIFTENHWIDPSTGLLFSQREIRNCAAQIGGFWKQLKPFEALERQKMKHQFKLASLNRNCPEDNNLLSQRPTSHIPSNAPQAPLPHVLVKEIVELIVISHGPASHFSTYPQVEAEIHRQMARQNWSLPVALGFDVKSTYHNLLREAAVVLNERFGLHIRYYPSGLPSSTDLQQFHQTVLSGPGFAHENVHASTHQQSARFLESPAIFGNSAAPFPRDQTGVNVPDRFPYFLSFEYRQQEPAIAQPLSDPLAEMRKKLDRLENIVSDSNRPSFVPFIKPEHPLQLTIGTQVRGGDNETNRGLSFEKPIKKEDNYSGMYHPVLCNQAENDTE